MELAIKISSAAADKLRAEARELGVSPETLAAAALDDLFSASDAEFRATAKRVLQKNRELYTRLA